MVVLRTMLKVPARALHVHACLPNTVGMLSVMDAVQLSKHSHLACAEQSQQIHWPLYFLCSVTC